MTRRHDSTLVSMFHDWSRRILNLEIWPPQTSVLSRLNLSILSVVFAHMHLQISEAERWLRFCDLHLPGKIKSYNVWTIQRFDNAFDEAAMIVRWSVNKKGGECWSRLLEEIYTVYWWKEYIGKSTLSSEISCGIETSWRKEVRIWFARYFQLYRISFVPTSLRIVVVLFVPFSMDCPGQGLVGWLLVPWKLESM